ncbi:hypothetical protein TWF718_009134 [Orbilia javanica]|uniref:Uncharacterized protein n=1 Tax=Orbilia javanica TaxID=47235 RepID=A0AAN8RG89_9PEZI
MAKDSMQIDTSATHKVTRGSRAPGPFSSPWMDLEDSSGRLRDYNAPPVPRPVKRAPTAPVMHNTTRTATVNSEPKPISQNEGQLQRQMTDLSLKTGKRLPMYQEHVCAEDFYKQPREVYENVVLVAAKSRAETQALESTNVGLVGGGRNEEAGGRESRSWRFESEVVWSDGGKGGYYENTTGERRVENHVRVPTTRTESQSAERMIQADGLQDLRSKSEAESSVGTSSLGAQERVEGPRSISGRGQETTITAGLQDRNDPRARRVQSPKSPQIPALPEDRPKGLAISERNLQNPTRKPISPEASGNDIRRRLESDTGGWKYAFELFELGKVPDSQTFIVDVLEEFINRRPQYWAGITKQGFDVGRYRETADDDLFLQISYTDAALDALRKGDAKRSLELVFKVMPVMNRRLETEGSWIQNIEAMELIVLMIYIPLKEKKYPPLKSAEDPDGLLKGLELGKDFRILSSERTIDGLKWYFQLHFLLAMLLEVDKRESFASRWIQWLDETSGEKEFRENIRRTMAEIQAVESLRYAAEDATNGSKSGWSKRPAVEGLASVSARYLSWFASIGHKEVILAHLATIYDHDTMVGWAERAFANSPVNAPLKPPKIPETRTSPQVLSQPWAGPSAESRFKEIVPGPGPVEVPRDKAKSIPPAPPRRQGSIRHPSPWESGSSSSSSSQVLPRDCRPSDRSISERGTPISPTSPLSSPPLSQRPFYDPQNWARIPPGNTEPSFAPQPHHPPRVDDPFEVYPLEKNLKQQRLSNFRGQPVRSADDCKVEELNAVTDYKQAVRQSKSLDVYIGTLASLRLINFISGNPEYRPWTPLIEAICNQRWEAAKTLIRLGALFDLGYPFHAALSRHFMGGSRSRCEKFIQKGIIKTGGLSADEYFFNESTKLIYFMIEAGVDVNAIGRGNTDLAPQMKTYPIHLAALDLVPTSPLLQKLLNMGANPWLKDANGQLALEYAKRSNNEHAIVTLVAAMSEKEASTYPST